MLRSEPSKQTAIELPINVVTECKNCPLPACSPDDCSRNSVRRLHLNEQSKGSLRSVIVIPERPF